MPRFAANLSLMFTEVPFLDRFAVAANSGFTAVEFLLPYAFSPEDIAARLKDNGLTCALFNLPPGDWSAGERGLASFPERFCELKEGVKAALPYAIGTGVKQLHLMAGLARRDDAKAAAAYRNALAWTCEFLGSSGLDVVIEPINRRNMPGYFLDDFAYAAGLIKDLAIPNLKLQFDIFHCQIIHGDVTMRLRELMPLIGHIQIASVPSRHEPDGEELNFPFLFAEIDRLAFSGFVGCEYNPRGATMEGLNWFAPYAAS